MSWRATVPRAARAPFDTAATRVAVATRVVVRTRAEVAERDRTDTTVWGSVRGAGRAAGAFPGRTAVGAGV